MRTLTKIALIAGVVYPVGTPESELEGMTDGERQSLVAIGALVDLGETPNVLPPINPPGPGSVQTTNPELTNESELSAFGIGKKLVDIMAENEPPLRTKADVMAYLVDHENLIPVNGIGAKSSEMILGLLGLS